MAIIIIRTEEGNYIVADSEYGGGTYYDADSYEDALNWSRKNGVEVDTEDFRDYYNQ